MANYRRRRWRETVTVGVDLNGLLAAAVGAGGLAAEELAGLEPELARVRDQLAARRAAGTLAFAELPHRPDDARRVVDVAAGLGADVDTLVVLGIGGSALGACALVSALGEGPGRRRVIVADSIDPDAFGALLGRLDAKRTLFNVISKSGETAETMAQFLVVRDRLLHELGAVDYKHHLVVTTGAEKGVLRQIVNDEGFRDLVVPDGVSGRFSVLTSVGLFPAAVAGIDGEELLAGAAYVDERARAAAPLGELLNAEQRATELALAKRGRPSATLVLPAVNPFTLGQLLYLLETATVAVGALAGIDPFGQPGVEEGKRLAYGLMGRPGFEANRAEVEAWLARKDARFIL